MTIMDVALMLEERSGIYEVPNYAPAGYIPLGGYGQKVIRLTGSDGKPCDGGIFYLAGNKNGDGTQKFYGVEFNEQTTKEEIEAEILKGREFVN